MQAQEICVAIGDGPSFPALVEPGQWNGFWCPRFDRATAERVVEWLNTERAAAPHHQRVEQPHAHWVGDTIVITEPGDPSSTDRIEPDEQGRYSIGAYAWCWERTDSPEQQTSP